MRNIGFVGGFWSTNIGNSFFNLGAEHILRKVFPEDNVVMIADQPGYWTFWNKKKGNPKNALDLIGSYDLDYLFLLGPCLTTTFGSIWKESLRKLYSRGTRVGIISAGQMKYSEEEIYSAKQVLKEFPPFLISTRDKRTYENFAQVCPNTYCGIDAAFFVSDVYEPVKINIGKFLVMNFDKLPEPYLIESKDSGTLEIDNTRFQLKFPKLRKWLGDKSDAFSYLLSFLPERTKDGLFGEYTIVRTNNRYNPMFVRRVYKYPNSFASDVPYSYLNLHSNAAMTITDRVHSCVASIVYGKPAMLFKKTGRSGLLDRVGAQEIQSRPVTIDLHELDLEKGKMMSFLKEVCK